MDYDDNDDQSPVKKNTHAFKTQNHKNKKRYGRADMKHTV